jgi:hypothetical protein
MRIWEISPRVNSPGNNDPDILAPIHVSDTAQTLPAPLVRQLAECLDDEGCGGDDWTSVLRVKEIAGSRLVSRTIRVHDLKLNRWPQFLPYPN